MSSLYVYVLQKSHRDKSTIGLTSSVLGRSQVFLGFLLFSFVFLSFLGSFRALYLMFSMVSWSKKPPVFHLPDVMAAARLCASTNGNQKVRTLVSFDLTGGRAFFRLPYILISVKGVKSKNRLFDLTFNSLIDEQGVTYCPGCLELIGNLSNMMGCL